MAAKFKIGDEVLTKYNVWPHRRQLIGKVVKMKQYYERGRYIYIIKCYEDEVDRNYYGAELNKYINRIDDLL